MATPTPRTSRIGDSALADKLRRSIQGDVLFDSFSRGRYSTDASIYQIEPIGVVLPRNQQDVARILQIASEEGVPVIPRGAGTSQAGQTVGEALIVDTSKYLISVLDIDVAGRGVLVEPGIVLDRLNRILRPHGLFFPVDVATASQATIGGMVGNNSAGARSLRYGMMVDNVHSIDAYLADGERMHFGEVPANLVDFLDASPEKQHDKELAHGPGHYQRLVRNVRALYVREHEEIEQRFPKVWRRVAGYNLDRVSPSGYNMADLLVGSEGTLAFFSRIRLKLTPIPEHTVMGVCQFPTLRAALDATRHIVRLGPSAVELADQSLLTLANENPEFQSILKLVNTNAKMNVWLLVEFAGEERDLQLKLLDQLDELLGSLGFPNAVFRAESRNLQRQIWALRKACLNIVMSIKGDRKPVSFIEDCAVPLEHLADYADRLTDVFERHETTGTWYAHASVGCLHIRPLLNLKEARDVSRMRAIAEEAHEIVREFKGTHSGEHGDGLVRSEFLEPMLGKRIVRSFETIKNHFDAGDIFNPGKIVRATRMDDRWLFRYKPTYPPQKMKTALDWSPWGGFAGAIEMCNNNGTCLRSSPGVMCPSYRITREEKHVTRGRANTLRLAVTGQLGERALTSPEMYETMDLCVGCKACKRECPTGVDMAKMKIEFLHHYHRRNRRSAADHLFAYLPRYAPWASHLSPLMNARNRSPWLTRLSQRYFGLTARRTLPTWRRGIFQHGRTLGPPDAREVVLLVDTFNTYFEPENAEAALGLLKRAGYRVIVPQPVTGRRPLCCGRTFLNAGMVERAREESVRVVETLLPYVLRNTPVVGLEPSCLLTLRDELPSLIPGDDAAAVAKHAVLFEEFLVAEVNSGNWSLPFGPLPIKQVLVHGHCHQKAFGAFPALGELLRMIPDLEVTAITSSCCGMAGSFGYEDRHYDASMEMGEMELLPAVRDADAETWIVTDGASCRKQVLDGTGRHARHVATVLMQSVAPLPAKVDRAG